MTEEEKKATEDLLAGFDRPGRSPRAPRVQSKFVDFTGEASSVHSRRGRDTVLVTRARRATLLLWLAIGVVITVSCVAVSWLALGARTATQPPRPPPVTPVTPVTAEPPPAVTTVVEPPPPVVPAPVVPPPVRSVAPRSSAPPPEDPRVDFVRNL